MSLLKEVVHMKKSYKRLVIDTATKYIYLSLVIDGVEVDFVYEVGNNNHSVTIMPYLKQILDAQKIELKDIDEVIVGIGPGSYTGVRIGVTVAKMIAYINQVKLYQVSSLLLMATHSNASYVLPMIDARRGNAFMAYLKNNGGQLEYIKDDCLENIDTFCQPLTEDYQLIEEGKPDVTKLLQSKLLEQVENVHELIPNYLQKTEAERHLKK